MTPGRPPFTEARIETLLNAARSCWLCIDVKAT
jgi:hypothetical protein